MHSCLRRLRPSTHALPLCSAQELPSSGVSTENYRPKVHRAPPQLRHPCLPPYQKQGAELCAVRCAARALSGRPERTHRFVRPPPERARPPAQPPLPPAGPGCRVAALLAAPPAGRRQQLLLPVRTRRQAAAQGARRRWQGVAGRRNERSRLARPARRPGAPRLFAHPSRHTLPQVRAVFVTLRRCSFLGIRSCTALSSLQLSFYLLIDLRVPLPPANRLRVLPRLSGVHKVQTSGNARFYRLWPTPGTSPF